MNKTVYQEQKGMLRLVIFFTLLFIAGQISFFLIHSKASELIDTLVNSTVSHELFHWIILYPILQFLFLQILAYVLLAMFVWFLAISFYEYFKLKTFLAGIVSIAFALVTFIALLSANAFFYPGSFFSSPLNDYHFLKIINSYVLIISVSILFFATFIAYRNTFLTKRHRKKALILIAIALSTALIGLYDSVITSPFFMKPIHTEKPNIIFIGMDSLRPDFVNFINAKALPTPTIDHFLSESTVFTEAYTPLARTFPTWVSILTAKYPLRNNARNNLADPHDIYTNDTIAKELQKMGYETIYATDEKRFSNITEKFGFNHIIGPKMGANDFLLGGLSDFPLTNLMINLPFGRFLFPYNYANRAAHITYMPTRFMQLIKLGLQNRSNKPLFLSIHLCLSHWPYTWAGHVDNLNESGVEKYQRSVMAVDDQLKTIMSILKENHLLDNTLVVLLSDHGTALGLWGDRFLTKKYYVGDLSKINLIPVTKLSAAVNSIDLKNAATINTAYGQGNDVLSLKQNHMLLAFRGFGISLPKRFVTERTSAIDIGPTVFDILNIKPLKNVDGESLKKYITQDKRESLSRSFYLESGDKVAEIEADKIDIGKVVKKRIEYYRIDLSSGLLSLSQQSKKSMAGNKQHAVMYGEWLLALYPAEMRSRFAPAKENNTDKKTSSQGKQVANFVKQEYKLEKYRIDPYYVLANLRTGEWTINFSSPLAKSAPVAELLRQLNSFYKDELPSTNVK